MTEFEQRLDTLIMMLADPNITINPSGFAKIKENLLSSAKEGLWHDAQGDDLPPIDEEVIVLCDDGHGCYKVSFGHRPFKKGYLGKSLVTGNIETYYPETYGKGGWNIPDVKWWLDCVLPNMEEQQ
jgi:hypothetical protein